MTLVLDCFLILLIHLYFLQVPIDIVEETCVNLTLVLLTLHILLYQHCIYKRFTHW